MWYAVQLSAKPIITKAVTSGLIAMVGDYMAQWIAYKLERRKTVHVLQPTSMQQTLSIHGSYNLRRGLSLLADGVFISGPLMHFGYNLFESILPAGTSSLAALSHVVADSILLDSFFVANAFVVTGIAEGYTPKDLIPQFQADYIPTLKASFATTVSLLPLSFACFRYLPVSFRVLAVNFVDVVWNAVISFMTHRSRRHDDLCRQQDTVLEQQLEPTKSLSTAEQAEEVLLPTHPL